MRKSAVARTFGSRRNSGWVILPALLAAQRVGPSGHVVAIDLSSAMLAVARRRAQEAGLGNIEFVEMDAETLGFDAASFDAVTCACGLMFLPDVAGTLRGIRRVLKPGGRLAVGVWGDPAKSPLLTAAGRAVAEYFPSAAPPDPDTPGPFRYAQPGSLDRTLREAGFSEVRVESLRMVIECASPADYWCVFTEMAAGVKDRIATLPEADRARLEASVKEQAAAFVENGIVRLAATPLCGVGTRPQPQGLNNS